MNQPLVSCIMPVADQLKYIPLAVAYFLNQDYPNKELVIVDDGKKSVLPILPSGQSQISYYYSPEYIGRTGVKRNYGCFKAKGEIIMHWDHDQWYAKDWMSRQVDFLITSGADITGLAFAHHYAPVTDTFWRGCEQNRNNPANQRQRLNGSTLAYWRTFLEAHPFKDLEEGGEDKDFVQHSGARIFAHDYQDGFVQLLHPGNAIESVLRFQL